ncbi:uncharacterized protein G2W53_011487 [Senna tora]|uniref:Uncharacterized protein n=1 Tax=Senna tora TaxID=362788 RepID=A0A834X1V1_9FABA|nr:uncharacterized protein G2W53_011487 [Senna tora]
MERSGRRSRGSDPGSKRSPPTKGQPGQHNGIDTRSTVEDNKVGVGETNNAITNIHNTPNTTTAINASS